MRPSVLTTRFSYMAPEIGGQLIFCVFSFYILKFYVDVYGLQVAAAGSILLIARCADAFGTPVWGVLFEKVRSRHGKCRPWFLWLSVPFAISGVLTFTTPHLGMRGKILYAAVTCVACSVLYTGINTPVSSILAELTQDVRERVTLTTFRMFGSKFGVLFVNLSLLALVAKLGHGNERTGFLLVMCLYAAGSIPMFLIGFRNLRENVPQQQKRLSVRQSVAALRGNVPWFITFIASLFFWIAFIARISAAPFYFQYVLHRTSLIAWANSLDAVSLASILLLPYFCRHASKTTVWALSLAGCALGQVIAFQGTQTHSSTVVMAGWTVGFLASGAAMALPFSILATSVDYGEWKTGIRAPGFLMAIGAAFCLKAGSGLGGALPAWIMNAYGYVPNATQTLRSIQGIVMSCIWLPAIAYALAVVPVLFYARYERQEATVQQELASRWRDLEAAAQL